MEKKKAWKYCVVGNIVKTRIDENGILRYGTAAFTGGTKVYLCGKCWDFSFNKISVVGLNRHKRYVADDVPPSAIENVRCSKVYKQKILDFMNYFEFEQCWWGNSKEDRKSTQAFVKEWSAHFPASDITEVEPTDHENRLIEGLIPSILDDQSIYNPMYFFGNASKRNELFFKLAELYSSAFPERKIIIISAERYFEGLFRSIKNDCEEEFQNTLRAADLLIMNDVEYMSAKHMTQLHFYYLFDYLYEHKKKIILGAAVSPSMIENIEDRVNTQIESGIICCVDNLSSGEKE